MKKYRVTIPFPVFVSVEVDAENPEEAEDAAFKDAYISSYAGNGGTDKLIGVDVDNVSIEAGESHIDSGGFSVNVEEV